MTTKLKDPDAILDYIFDWEDWLQGDTISSSTFTISPSVVGELEQPVSPVASFTDKTAKVWLKGGLIGKKYTVTNRIQTAAGRKEDWSITVYVQQK